MEINGREHERKGPGALFGNQEDRLLPHESRPLAHRGFMAAKDMLS
jgi:hypothetical protein